MLLCECNRKILYICISIKMKYYDFKINIKANRTGFF